MEKKLRIFKVGLSTLFFVGLFSLYTSYELKKDYSLEIGDTIFSSSGNDSRLYEGFLFIRIVVLVDQTMLDYYKDMEKLIQYALTLIRGANELFRKGHLGRKILLSVGRIFLSKNLNRIMTSSRNNAKENLITLCKWTKRRNTINEPHLSLFLTRRSLCSFELHTSDEPSSCLTLGLAKMGSLCSLDTSCIVNQDIGFNTIQTIAHEIAHTMGISHDDPGDHSQFVMSAKIRQDVPTFLGDFIWSQKSRNQFQRFFLSTEASFCMRNSSPFESDLVAAFDQSHFLPGISWSGDDQCRFIYGRSQDDLIPEEPSRRCQFSSICKELWCQVNGICKRAPSIPLEGTTCGYHRWCIRENCVPMRSNDFSEGQWESWSAWSQCSRSCRAGVSTSKRRCIPSKTGGFCKNGAKNLRYKLCNMDLFESCTDPDPHYECRKKLYRETRNSVKSGLRNGCKIFCEYSAKELSPNTIRHHTFSVEDGIFCSLDEKSICISGECSIVGCDGRPNSKMKEDECRVCGGDNSTCETFMNSVRITRLKTRLIFVTEFDDKAFNIYIRMKDNRVIKKQNRCYLAITAEGDGFVNVMHVYNDIRRPGRYFVRDPTSGSQIKVDYEDEEMELSTITSTVKISSAFKDKTLRVYVLNPSFNVVSNISIEWSYKVSFTKVIGPQTFEHFQTIESEECFGRPCGIWWTGPWKECNDPLVGIKQRDVYCLTPEKEIVSLEHCRPDSKPSPIAACDEEVIDDNSAWIPGNWTSCSVTCGYGMSMQEYICQEGSCDSSKRPDPKRKECFNTECRYEWWYESWGKCHEGLMKRLVYCFDERRDLKVEATKCPIAMKPKDTKECSVN